MRMRSAVSVGLLFLVIASLGLAATNAEMYFSSDKNGQNRVTNVQEGNSVWIVVRDPDENIDCDVRDKIWTDVKIMDPKTGAYIVWKSYGDIILNGITGKSSFDPYDAEGYFPYKGHFPGNPGSLAEDYLEETGADTGVFVSSHAFQIGTREDVAVPYKSTHVVDRPSSPPDEFQWGAYLYSDIQQENVPLKYHPGVAGDVLRWVGVAGGGSPLAYDIGFVDVPYNFFEMPSQLLSTRSAMPSGWLVGRFENMDTLIGMYQDPNDDTDVATSMMKIVDTQSAIAWDREIYKDANEAATITVTDADENLDCNAVEYVPVFILVDPGSWNPVGTVQSPSEQTNASPNNFCMLKRTGGVDGSAGAVGDYRPIRWWNIYNAEKNDYGVGGAQDGRYYVQYPKLGTEEADIHKTLFDTASANGITAVSFYAQETGPNTGVFQLNLNSLLVDLGFNSLNVRDVLVAYYLDPNDEDDFQLDVAYIEEKMHSITSFTDATRQDKKLFWIGRDPVYVQVIDSNANVDSCCPEQVIVHLCDPHDEDDGEFWVLDETSSNSPVFFSNGGMELLPTWDGSGVGESVRSSQGTLVDGVGGYQLVLDNWKLEVFNEDHIYVRYNDAQYMQGDNGYAGLADSDTRTAYSGPRIDQVRVSNDVSFDLMEIGDTQVYDGTTTTMYFLDRQANRMSGYSNSDCVFIEVVDPDQNEDTLRRERIDGYWDGGQNFPFGPVPLNRFDCDYCRCWTHPVNALLGDTNIFNDSPDPYAGYSADGAAKIYVLNPRSGRWAGLDLLETGVTTGDFVSVICVDLTSQYGDCVPTLGALPGDTIVAFYQDPSNHSDSAMISVKVGIGGGTTPASQTSTTTFTNAAGVAVQNYTDADLVYVRVVDPSHAGAAVLRNAVTLLGVSYDLLPIGGAGCRDDNMPPLPPVVGDDVFITIGLDLGLQAGTSITATYKDPNDPNDTSSDTITVVASKLDVTRFYAGPSPAAGDVTFGYAGTGIASVMSVEVYDLAGRLVWASELANVTKVVWSLAAGDRSAANGCYIYLVTATDGTETFRGKGTVFISR
jgi:hypothetical protein